jgi:hypothetical protein
VLVKLDGKQRHDVDRVAGGFKPLRPRSVHCAVCGVRSVQAFQWRYLTEFKSIRAKFSTKHPFLFTTMADNTRRNVHVYSSSNGTEVAGESKRLLLPPCCLMLQGFFQHGGVSVSTFIGWISNVCFVPGDWDLYPCQIGNNRASDGPALDRNSEDELQPGRYVMRTPPPGDLPRFSVVFTADICASQSRHKSSFILPQTFPGRERTQSIIHIPLTFVSGYFSFLTLRRSPTNTLGHALRNTSQGARRALLCYGSISCW